MTNELARADMERAVTMALAIMSASDVPEDLREMAWRTYTEMAWNLQWNYECSDTGETKSGLLLWDGVYAYGVEEFLASLPDVIRQRYLADVIIAKEAAKAIDQAGHSTDFRLECLVSLNRTLWRLIDHAEDAGITVTIKSFDSVLEDGWFLAHLDRVINKNGLVPDDDDDAIDDDTDQFERSTNGSH